MRLQPVGDEQLERRERREVGYGAPATADTVGHEASVVVGQTVQGPADVGGERFEGEDGPHGLGMLPVRRHAVGARVDVAPAHGHVGRTAGQKLAVERGSARDEVRGAAGVVDRGRAERPEAHRRLRPRLVQHVARVKSVVVRLRRSQPRGQVPQAGIRHVGVRAHVMAVAVGQPRGLVGAVIVRAPVHPHVKPHLVGGKGSVELHFTSGHVADMGVGDGDSRGETRIRRANTILPGQVAADFILLRRRQRPVVGDDFGDIQMGVAPATPHLAAHLVRTRRRVVVVDDNLDHHAVADGGVHGPQGPWTRQCGSIFRDGRRPGPRVGPECRIVRLQHAGRARSPVRRRRKHGAPIRPEDLGTVAGLEDPVHLLGKHVLADVDIFIAELNHGQSVDLVGHELRVASAAGTRSVVTVVGLVLPRHHAAAVTLRPLVGLQP